MTEENDLILINNIKKGVKKDSSLEVLYSRHSGIFHKILNKYMPFNTLEKEEISSECKYHIFVSALDFNESKKTKFSSYLGNRTRWMCLNFFQDQKKNKIKSRISTQDPDPSECFLEKIEGEEFISKIKDFLESHPDARAKTIFEMRYFNTKNKKLTPWKKISKEIGLSVQGCINIHNNFIEKIRKTSQILK